MNNAQENFRYAQRNFHYAQVMRSFMDADITGQKAMKNQRSRKMFRAEKRKQGQETCKNSLLFGCAIMVATQRYVRSFGNKGEQG